MITRDGARLQVRPIEPGDKQALLRGFEHLGRESRYRRFLAPIRRLTQRDLAYFTELDHSEHEALVAFNDEGEMVAVARYVLLDDRPGVAEVAVTVADDWQQRGVGTALLERLAQRAVDTGVRSFLGLCLADNRDMQELLRELAPGCRSRRVGDGLVELEVDLPKRASHRNMASAVRVAARGFHGRRAGRDD
jgi:GNAT superfamily N-acetyltransferase